MDEETMKEKLDSNRARTKQATKFAAGKGVQAAGKGTQVAGKAVGGLGKRLTATKYGAVVGVPLQFAGKGMEAGGKGAQMAGKKMARRGMRGAAQKPGFGEAVGKMTQPGGGMGGASPTDLLKPGGASEQIRNVSAEALKQSWLNLVSTYGITFIYIIFHFIGHYLGGPLSRFFCKPGEEGAFGIIPKKYQAIVGAVAGKTGMDKTIDAGSEYAELTVFGALCMLLLIIILIIIGLIAVLLNVLNII